MYLYKYIDREMSSTYRHVYKHTDIYIYTYIAQAPAFGKPPGDRKKPKQILGGSWVDSAFLEK